VIFGGYLFGVGSTLCSFIVLGNETMGIQMHEQADFIHEYVSTGDLYAMIIHMMEKMPFSVPIMLVVLVTMIAFYATSFDSIALIASCYSYHKLEEQEQPHKLVQLMWCILLIILPIALVFSESSMSNLQSVSMIAAFPLGIVMLLIIASFLKDAKNSIRKHKENADKKAEDNS
jgi:BCCT family betaine/carnitine transporter